MTATMTAMAATTAFPYPSRLNRMSADTVTRALHHAIGTHVHGEAMNRRRYVVHRDPISGEVTRIGGWTWAEALTRAGEAFGW